MKLPHAAKSSIIHPPQSNILKVNTTCLSTWFMGVCYKTKDRKYWKYSRCVQWGSVSDAPVLEMSEYQTFIFPEIKYLKSKWYPKWHP